MFRKKLRLCLSSDFSRCTNNRVNHWIRFYSAFLVACRGNIHNNHGYNLHPRIKGERVSTKVWQILEKESEMADKTNDGKEIDRKMGRRFKHLLPFLISSVLILIAGWIYTKVLFSSGSAIVALAILIIGFWVYPDDYDEPPGTIM